MSCGNAATWRGVEEGMGHCPGWGAMGRCMDTKAEGRCLY